LVRRRAESIDICLTVVSALCGLFPYGGDVLGGNEEACKVAERFSDVRFLAILDPRQEESFEQVASLLGHPRCVGIKIHPWEHGYEIRDYGEAVFEFAARHDALVQTHSGHPGSYPEDFVPFANQHPDMSLVLAHLGNSDDGDYTRQIVAVQRSRAGNVYVDTSSQRSITSGLIEWAVSEIGADRLLFGSDSPFYFPASQKARIEYAEIEDRAKRAILFENATRLLGEELGE
jgi:predicted TIM-barrel fold metal-dependent hydrolase